MKSKIISSLLITLFIVSGFATLAHALSWVPTLGDANYGCSSTTISLSDINWDSSLLTSNIYKKAAMVHAMAVHKEYAGISSIDFSASFMLPYPPKPSLSATYNPQTIEGSINIYDGATKTLYLSGIQWIINPWMANQVNVWQNNGWVSMASLTIQPYMWYSYRWHLVRGDASSSYVELYRGSTLVGHWQSYATEIHSDWDSTSSWWLQLENISAWPNCLAQPACGHSCSTR